MKLTAEQQARALAVHGVCANEACDKCGKVLAEVRYTRKDTPETYDLLLPTVPRWSRATEGPMRRVRCRPCGKTSWRSLVLRFVPNAESGQGLSK
jgi:phage FluMu protein Com